MRSFLDGSKWRGNIPHLLPLALFAMSFHPGPSSAAGVAKAVPETPSSSAAISGTYCCRDGDCYHVHLTLNADRTYVSTGSTCLKSKGPAAGTGTWQLSNRKVVLAPSQESGWMKNEPKTFNVLKFKGNWILVRADWPDYYDQHGVTDVSCFQRQAPGRCYSSVSDNELLRMAPFTAIVEKKQPCAVYIMTENGRRLCLGGPGASSEVAAFVQSLAPGRPFSFPDVLVESRKRRSEKP